jgi:hypothetical protein
VTGALIQDTCSEAILLASSEGGALMAGTYLGSNDKAAGETRIFAGGVGGTDGESLVGAPSDGHRLMGGITMAGYRFLVED